MKKNKRQFIKSEVRDVKLPPCSRWELRSSAIKQRVAVVPYDVSEQPIGPVFKGQESKKKETRRAQFSKTIDHFLAQLPLLSTPNGRVYLASNDECATGTDLEGSDSDPN
jgi:hypothetical protein